LADIPPVTGMCLVIALVAVIVAVVAGANLFLIAALAAVVVALASRIG
jgi:cell division protein FtsW (lipid II flippase)